MPRKSTANTASEPQNASHSGEDTSTVPNTAQVLPEAPEPAMPASEANAVSEGITLAVLKNLEGRLGAVENVLVQMVAGLIVKGQLGPISQPEKMNGTAALRGEPQEAPSA